MAQLTAAGFDYVENSALLLVLASRDGRLPAIARRAALIKFALLYAGWGYIAAGLVIAARERRRLTATPRRKPPHAKRRSSLSPVIDGENITTVSFGCYGTLIDSAAGRAAFFAALALERTGGEPAPGRQLREGWERAQYELVIEPYRPYKQVLREACRRLADEQGWTWDEADAARFLAATRVLQPFLDTVPVLERLRAAGLRLAVVFNTDRELLGHTLRQLEVPIDVVVTAEDCGAYKPSQRVFAVALEAIGEPPTRILHAAFGFLYDIPPAQAIGLRTAWINRRGQARPEATVPDHEWRKLWQLADTLGA